MLAERVGSQSRSSNMQSASEARVEVMSWSPLKLAAESPGPHTCLDSETISMLSMQALILQRETAKGA